MFHRDSSTLPKLRGYYTVEEAAAIIGVSPYHLRSNICCRRKLLTYRLRRFYWGPYVRHVIVIPKPAVKLYMAKMAVMGLGLKMGKIA